MLETAGGGVIFRTQHFSAVRTVLISIGIVAPTLLATFLWLTTPEPPVKVFGQSFNTVETVAKLGWIAVAVVAIVAVYRLVAKAIEGNRNVKLEWKITEKVSGRLLIKRVEVGRAAVRTSRKKTA